jgi:hypothetical protein
MTTAIEGDNSQRELLDLTRRFEKFLSAVDSHKRVLNRRESFHLQSFLEFLGSTQWQEADAALRRAEQLAPIPAQFASLTSTNVVAGTVELRAELARILGGEQKNALAEG